MITRTDTVLPSVPMDATHQLSQSIQSPELGREWLLARNENHRINQELQQALERRGRPQQYD